MPLMTTADFVKLIQQQDSSGSLLVSFRIVDEDYPDDLDLVAHGEIESVETSIKYAQATDEGDRDVLRLRIALCTQV